MPIIAVLYSPVQWKPYCSVSLQIPLASACWIDVLAVIKHVQVLAGSRFAEGSLCQCSLLFIYVCFSILPKKDILREKEQRDNEPLRSGLIPGKFCAKCQESHRCIPPETMKLCVLVSCGGAWDGRCPSGTLVCVHSIMMAFLRHKFG